MSETISTADIEEDKARIMFSDVTFQKLRSLEVSGIELTDNTEDIIRSNERFFNILHQYNIDWYYPHTSWFKTFSDLGIDAEGEVVIYDVTLELEHVLEIRGDPKHLSSDITSFTVLEIQSEDIGDHNITINCGKNQTDLTVKSIIENLF